MPEFEEEQWPDKPLWWGWLQETKDELKETLMNMHVQRPIEEVRYEPVVQRPDGKGKEVSAETEGTLREEDPAASS